MCKEIYRTNNDTAQRLYSNLDRNTKVKKIRIADRRGMSGTHRTCTSNWMYSGRRRPLSRDTEQPHSRLTYSLPQTGKTIFYQLRQRLYELVCPLIKSIVSPHLTLLQSPESGISGQRLITLTFRRQATARGLYRTLHVRRRCHDSTLLRVMKCRRACRRTRLGGARGVEALGVRPRDLQELGRCCCARTCRRSARGGGC